MLGKFLASPLLTFDSTVPFCSLLTALPASTHKIPVDVNLRIYGSTLHPAGNWKLRSTAQIQGQVLGDEDNQTWDSCRKALSAFNFGEDEQDKILGKAFGHIHSPYWGEERKKEVPRYEVVAEVLTYLKGLGLNEDDMGKLLKKFPEVLGCSLEDEIRANVQILESQWGIKGKNLTKLILRNPKVLGYNIDCKGDCEAQCTRCWARF